MPPDLAMVAVPLPGLNRTPLLCERFLMSVSIHGHQQVGAGCYRVGMFVPAIAAVSVDRFGEAEIWVRDEDGRMRVVPGEVDADGRVSAPTAGWGSRWTVQPDGTRRYWP